MEAEAKLHSPIVQSSCFVDMLWTWDPDVVKELTSNDELFGKVKGLVSLFDEMSAASILKVEGAAWRRQKDILKPSFQADHLRSMTPRFNTVADRLIDRLAALADGKTSARVKDLLQRATLESLGLAGFGFDFRALCDDTTIHEGFEIYTQMMSTLTSPLIIFPGAMSLPLPAVQRVKNTARRYMEFLGSLVQRKRSSTGGEHDGEHDILELMLASHHDGTGDGLSEKEILNNMNVFFIAGHETTASSLLFALHMLAQHPQMQETLHQEVIEHLGTDAAVPASHEQVSKLKYLSLFIQETLRHFPPAAAIKRRAKRDCVLAGYRVLRGDLIQIPVYTMHHHPALWQDPEKFWPERFLPENSQHRHPFAFLPFSVGQRSCIGSNFALLEMKIILARIVQSFAFAVDPNSPAPFKLQTDVSLSLPSDHTLLIARRSS